MTTSRKKNYAQPTTNYKLLVLSLSGIGNYLMHTSFIAQVKQQRPHWRLTLWCAARGQGEFARVNPAIDEVIEASMQSPFLKDLSLIFKLRRGRYDTAVMLSPGQRVKGAAYLAAAGIPRRIAHRYPLCRNPSSAFLLTNAIPEQDGLHDIEQNLALLKSLDLTCPSPPTPYNVTIPSGYRTQAEVLLKHLNIPQHKTLIGLHPGSAPNATFKRWPLGRFAAVARALIQQHNTHILIFGGPGEEELKRQLSLQITHRESPATNHSSRVTIISTDLLGTAAVIARCRLFVSNDSGLMHISAAAGTPTLGLFGPTNERQVGPRGPHSHTLRAPNTEPAYDTEQNSKLGNAPHTTMYQLSTEQVTNAAIRFLNRSSDI